MIIKVLKQYLIILGAILLNACNHCSMECDNNNKVIQLKLNWTFKETGKEEFLSASVPGTVHTDLLALNKIPYPFYRLNEKKLQWVDKTDWIYNTYFNIDSTDLTSNTIKLKFYGIDTYSDIYLNGKKVLETNNMFRQWEIDVRDYLTEGENKLEVRLFSPIKKGLELLEENKYPLPAVNDQSTVGGLGNKKVSVFTRKAPYHYGWDWGPRFVTTGIWRPVELEIIHNSHILDLYYLQKEVSEKEADIVVNAELEIKDDDFYILQINDLYTGKKLAKTSLFLSKGKQHVAFPIHIKKPKLWWPNGYGHQNLYAFNAQLKRNRKIIDSQTDNIGLRSVELVRDVDSVGTSFYFKVNGIPVFAKGANYIPQDNFLSRVTKEKYTSLIKDAVDANMNMLRVWGGGIYEEDIFYSLCDKYGLMVWQDFMFACSMYPGNDLFLENVKEEAIDNIKRLRDHASIVLWCGNNEIDVAWYQNDSTGGWKWKEQYDSDTRNKIWEAYDTLFHTILPEIVNKYDQSRTYWPSSPLADWNEHATNTSTSGDMHYWGVWHGGESFEQYYEVIPRFMSEYGFQSFPEFATIKEFTLPKDWNMKSDVIKAHQRSPIGNDKINDYMREYYPVPKDFTDKLYIGQSLQAYGVKMAIDAHRIHKPYTMGSLYWQLNDCWPGASWSGIDYYGRWKALHYMVKEAFKPTALAFNREGDAIELFVVNDDRDLKSAVLKVKLKDFYGNEEELFSGDVAVNFEKSTKVFSYTLAKEKKELVTTDYYLEAELNTEWDKLDTELFYFKKPKDLNLPKANPNISLERLSDQQYKLLVYSDKLIKDMAFSLKNTEAFFSVNYFDLQPFETKEILINTLSKEEIDLADIETKMLNTIINSNP